MAKMFYLLMVITKLHILDLIVLLFSSSLYIETGEFADKSSSWPNVPERMAFQRVSNL